MVQSVHNLNLFFNRKLNFRQKLVYLNSYLYWWSFLRRLLFIFAPILFTAFDVMVVDTDFWVLLAFWLPSFFLMNLVMTDISSDLRTQRWGEIQETIFAPFLVLPVLFQSIGLKETKFKVTNKDATQSRKDLLYVIPHAIMLTLAIYGLIRFNYGKFGIEIFYGSVISFWLLSHILNLTFACMYYLGRPIFRNSERFAMTLPIVLKAEGKDYQFETHDISETGLSFISDFPYYFPDEVALNFSIEKKGHIASFTGHVVRVWQRDKVYHYGVVIDEMDKHNYLQYLLVIYDGFNGSLRSTMDPMITLIDTFVMNIQRREQMIHNKAAFSQKYPNIKVNQEIHHQVIHSFNYHEMEVSGALLGDSNDEKVLTVGDVNFQLKYNRTTPEGNRVYTVVNRDELVRDDDLTDLIRSWVGGELTV